MIILIAVVTLMRLTEDPPNPEEMWDLHYYGPLTAGMELSLEIRSPYAIRTNVVEGAPGLPETAGQALASQLDYLLPYASPDFPSHATLVSSLCTFD